MKTKIIEMYRPSQYKSWEKAKEAGGVYCVVVPEDTSHSTMSSVIDITSDCMSANDRAAWRVKPAELTPFQKAFMMAYYEKVGELSSEHVEAFLRSPCERPLGWTWDEYNLMNDHYRMFVAGSQYSNKV